MNWQSAYCLIYDIATGQPKIPKTQRYLNELIGILHDLHPGGYGNGVGVVAAARTGDGVETV